MISGLTHEELRDLLAHNEAELRRVYERGELFLVTAMNPDHSRVADAYQKLIPSVIPWETARFIIRKVGPVEAGEIIRTEFFKKCITLHQGEARDQ
jgi:hypothetical protein